MVEPSDDRNHAQRALKIVLTLHDTSEFAERLVCGEFEKLCELRHLPSIINVDVNSLRKYVDEDGAVVGVGYLMEAVGVPLTADQAKQPRIVKKLLKSLEALHTAGHYHGDSRVNNALLLGGEIVWVDLVNAGKAGADDNVHKRRDLSDTIGSVYGRDKLLEPDFEELLHRYPSEVVNVDPFVQYFTQG
jgi:tRNA A-37 threonylcarbamoyl transferase component Bud32